MWLELRPLNAPGQLAIVFESRLSNREVESGAESTKSASRMEKGSVLALRALRIPRKHQVGGPGERLQVSVVLSTAEWPLLSVSNENSREYDS